MNAKTLTALPETYPAFLEDIKTRIRESQIRAAQSVNQELVKLYWWIGQQIVRKQEAEDWGSQVIDKLCKDVQSSLPGLSGFSRSNVFRMRAFYLSYSIVAPAVRQLENPPEFCLSIPWAHNVILFEKLKNLDEREWYARRAVQNGWSRTMLQSWIESGLYLRQGKAPNNFQDTLPPPQSDLAEQSLKDPYCFEFLTLFSDAKEKEIEDGLIQHVQKFLLELGTGFAFIGRQIPLNISGENYYLDLVFYHVKLKCYFLIELKAVEFKPEFVGKMNFYLSAIDDLMRDHSDQPTIGLILCKGKDRVKVEYALRDVRKPIGIANFETQIVESLPENLKGTLPTVAEIEEELQRSLNREKL
jgi:predicted nuclease of restriction endonuclease-like (RecB) superfamily